jgi:hypothetical protein
MTFGGEDRGGKTGEPVPHKITVTGLGTGYLGKFWQRIRILELERRCSCLVGLEHSKPIYHTHLAQNSVNVTLNGFFRET